MDIARIIDITGGKASRDGGTVVVGYCSNGYLRLRPCTVTLDGVELPAVEIMGRLARQNGARQAELRGKLRAAGIEIR